MPMESRDVRSTRALQEEFLLLGGGKGSIPLWGSDQELHRLPWLG